MALESISSKAEIINVNINVPILFYEYPYHGPQGGNSEAFLLLNNFLFT